MKFLKLIIVSLFFSLFATTSYSDTVRLVIWSSPGGGNHAYALRLQPVIERAMNRKVVIEFKTGAEGIIAARYVNEFKDKDDLVLMFGSPATWENVSNKEQLSHLTSFKIVTFLGNFPYYIVTNKNKDVVSFKQLIEQSNVRLMSYGISLNAPPRPLFKMLFEKHGNMKNVAEITYKGGSQSVMSAASNVVDFGIGSPEYIMPLVEDGRLKIIGVLDGKKTQVAKPLREQGIIIENEFKYYANIFMWANKGSKDQDIILVRNAIQRYLLSDESKDHREKTFMSFESDDFLNPEEKLRVILN